MQNHIGGIADTHEQFRKCVTSFPLYISADLALSLVLHRSAPATRHKVASLFIGVGVIFALAPTWLVVKSLWLTLFIGLFVVKPLAARHPALAARLDLQKCILFAGSALGLTS